MPTPIFPMVLNCPCCGDSIGWRGHRCPIVCLDIGPMRILRSRQEPDGSDKPKPKDFLSFELRWYGDDWHHAPTSMLTVSFDPESDGQKILQDVLKTSFGIPDVPEPDKRKPGSAWGPWPSSPDLRYVLRHNPGRPLDGWMWSVEEYGRNNSWRPTDRSGWESTLELAHARARLALRAEAQRIGPALLDELVELRQMCASVPEPPGALGGEVIRELRRREDAFKAVHERIVQAHALEQKLATTKEPRVFEVNGPGQCTLRHLVECECEHPDNKGGDCYLGVAQDVLDERYPGWRCPLQDAPLLVRLVPGELDAPAAIPPSVPGNSDGAEGTPFPEAPSSEPLSPSKPSPPVELKPGMIELRPGMRVRVRKPGRLCGECWVPGMDQYDGRVLTLREQIEAGFWTTEEAARWMDGTPHRWLFSSSWLTPVEDLAAFTPDPAPAFAPALDPLFLARLIQAIPAEFRESCDDDDLPPAIDRMAACINQLRRAHDWVMEALGAFIRLELREDPRFGEPNAAVTAIRLLRNLTRQNRLLASRSATVPPDEVVDALRGRIRELEDPDGTEGAPFPEVPNLLFSAEVDLAAARGKADGFEKENARLRRELGVMRGKVMDAQLVRAEMLVLRARVRELEAGVDLFRAGEHRGGEGK